MELLVRRPLTPTEAPDELLGQEPQHNHFQAFSELLRLLLHWNSAFISLESYRELWNPFFLILEKMIKTSDSKINMTSYRVCSLRI